MTLFRRLSRCVRFVSGRYGNDSCELENHIADRERRSPGFAEKVDRAHEEIGRQRVTRSSVIGDCFPNTGMDNEFDLEHHVSGQMDEPHWFTVRSSNQEMSIWVTDSSRVAIEMRAAVLGDPNVVRWLNLEELDALIYELDGAAEFLRQLDVEVDVEDV